MNIQPLRTLRWCESSCDQFLLPAEGLKASRKLPFLCIFSLGNHLQIQLSPTTISLTIHRDGPNRTKPCKKHVLKIRLSSESLAAFTVCGLLVLWMPTLTTSDTQRLSHNLHISPKLSRPSLSPEHARRSYSPCSREIIHKLEINVPPKVIIW